jgi:hypothetical protein
VYTVDLRSLILEDSIVFDKLDDVCDTKGELLHENGSLGPGEFSLDSVVNKGAEL